MKALVTGSCGFIGSHLVSSLIERSIDVYALVRKTSDTSWLNGKNVTLLPGDYSDVDSLIKAVDGMDYVYHLGAVIQAPDWDTYYRVNTLGTQNLLFACYKTIKNLKRFVFVSSIAASGPSTRGSLKAESDACNPKGGYGKSKLLAEKACRRYRNRIPVVIVRPPNILGIHQKELYKVCRLIKKRILPMLGNKEKQTSICFVQDLVKALILVAENERAIGETYFVTDNQVYSWHEILYYIADIQGVLPYVITVPHPVMYTIAFLSEFVSGFTNTVPLISRERVISTRKYYFLIDGSKIRKELGFEPQIQFEDGMREIIDWYRVQGLL